MSDDLCFYHEANRAAANAAEAPEADAYKANNITETHTAVATATEADNFKKRPGYLTAVTSEEDSGRTIIRAD